MAETVVEAQRSLLMMFAIYWKKIKIEIMRNGPRELIACEKAYECALNAETSKNRLEMLLKRSIDLIGDNGHLILMEKNETDPENEMSQIRWRLWGCQKRYDRFCRRKEDDSGRMNWRCWGRAFSRNPRLRRGKRRGVPNSEWKRFNFSIPQKHNRGYWEEFNGKRWFFMIIEILLFWFKEFFLSEFYWTGTMPSTWDDWDDEPKQNSSSAGFGIEFVWNQWLQIDDWDEKPKKPTRKPSFTGIWRWVASFWWNIMIVLKCRYLGWRWWGYWQEWKDDNLFWYVGWE